MDADKRSRINLVNRLMKMPGAQAFRLRPYRNDDALDALAFSDVGHGVGLEYDKSIGRIFVSATDGTRIGTLPLTARVILEKGEAYAACISGIDHKHGEGIPDVDILIVPSDDK